MTYTSDAGAPGALRVALATIRTDRAKLVPLAVVVIGLYAAGILLVAANASAHAGLLSTASLFLLTWIVALGLWRWLDLEQRWTPGTVHPGLAAPKVPTASDNMVR